MIDQVKLCKSIIEHKNPTDFFGASYGSCNRVAKYTIKYNEPARGKYIERDVCGIHFLSAKKNADRIKKRTGFDMNFTWEEI